MKILFDENVSNNIKEGIINLGIKDVKQIPKDKSFKGNQYKQPNSQQCEKTIETKQEVITIQKDKYIIEYKNKTGVFGKIKRKEISFEKLNNSTDKH